MLFRSWKRIAAVLVIPLVFIIAIPQLEEGLFTTPTVESFDSAHAYYESLGGEDFDGPLYYDEERGVLVVGDREFEPEIVPNPDCLVDAPRVLGIVAEAANPFSGNALTMIADAVPEVPLWALSKLSIVGVVNSTSSSCGMAMMNTSGMTSTAAMRFQRMRRKSSPTAQRPPMPLKRPTARVSSGRPVGK